MTFRRRLGVLATAVSGLLAAALLLSAPALAWHGDVSNLHSRCPSNPHPDQTRVAFDLTLSDQGRSGSVAVSYSINDGATTDVPASGVLNNDGKPQSTFGPTDTVLHLHFLVPSPAQEGMITVLVTTTFGDETPRKPVPTSTKLVVCAATEDTTTTTPPTTVVAPPSTEAPASTLAPTSTAALAALGAESTSGSGDSLPHTGSNSIPVVIAAFAMLAGGGGLLIASRVRARHAR